MQSINSNNFKMHCSSLANIMGGSLYPSITDVIKNILKKIEDGKALTEKQQQAYDKYQEGMKRPSLSTGAKTVCRRWVTEQRYQQNKSFSNKYVKKGNLTEDDSIVLVGQFLSLLYNEITGLKPDEERPQKSNDFIVGTCDKIIPELDAILDVKNSYTCFSFPTYEEVIKSTYYAQGQGYMKLYNRSRYILAYCLMDLPPNLMKKEAISTARDMERYDLISDIVAHFDEDLPLSDMDLDAAFIIEDTKKQHTYSHLPISDRVIIYEFPRNDAYIEEGEKRIKLCRKYIDNVVKGLTNVRRYNDDLKLVEKIRI